MHVQNFAMGSKRAHVQKRNFRQAEIKFSRTGLRAQCSTVELKASLVKKKSKKSVSNRTKWIWLNIGIYIYIYIYVYIYMKEQML